MVSTGTRKREGYQEPMSPSKVYPEINYDFQPISFWSAAANPLDVALRNVKGRNRREMIRDFYAEGNLEALCDELLSDTLDEEVRDSIGRIHPSFMGGEYLPNYARRIYPLARLALNHRSCNYGSAAGGSYYQAAFANRSLFFRGPSGYRPRSRLAYRQGIRRTRLQRYYSVRPQRRWLTRTQGLPIRLRTEC
jgi:hypothetical protein